MGGGVSGKEKCGLEGLGMAKEDDHDGDVVGRAFLDGMVDQLIGGPNGSSRCLRLARCGGGVLKGLGEAMTHHIDGLLIVHDVPKAVTGNDEELDGRVDGHLCGEGSADDKVLEFLVTQGAGDGQNARYTIMGHKAARLSNARLLASIGGLVVVRQSNGTASMTKDDAGIAHIGRVQGAGLVWAIGLGRQGRLEERHGGRAAGGDVWIFGQSLVRLDKGHAKMLLGAQLGPLLVLHNSAQQHGKVELAPFGRPLACMAIKDAKEAGALYAIEIIHKDMRVLATY